MRPRATPTVWNIDGRGRGLHADRLVIWCGLAATEGAGDSLVLFFLGGDGWRWRGLLLCMMRLLLLKSGCSSSARHCFIWLRTFLFSSASPFEPLLLPLFYPSARFPLSFSPFSFIFHFLYPRPHPSLAFLVPLPLPFSPASPCPPRPLRPHPSLAFLVPLSLHLLLRRQQLGNALHVHAKITKPLFA